MPFLGSVELKAPGETKLHAEIPRNGSGPWRFRITSQDVKLGASQQSDTINLQMENHGAKAIRLAFWTGGEEITIPPGGSKQVFSGSFDELLRIGQAGNGALQILSSPDYKTDVTLHFVSNLHNPSVKLDVSLWYMGSGF